MLAETLSGLVEATTTQSQTSSLEPKSRESGAFTSKRKPFEIPKLALQHVLGFFSSPRRRISVSCEPCWDLSMVAASDNIV
ncbi:hypothetical protein VNO78_16943 [Psophocarpus tetragonolobus]|uniref:Uncharacterized protein n=1 Tax=Psophocarpus tetragonolobus TaxID=3891 RepID=A0AAN9SGF4_PSOTE